MVDNYPLKDDTSETKNQHFISQVEQRQNSLNPSAEIRNQRIYQFAILERDQRRIQLTAQGGLSISKSLSMEDLFSFDVKDKKVRANFEKIFESYERRISNLTTEFLQHAPGITQHREIFDLFIAKIINYIRNPFCIEKVINTFGSFAEYHPTDAKIYNRC
nr:hypothetical protein [uncultured Neokomagataea sp.]